MVTPPAGTVTFLMTDIEGSTRLWEEHGERFVPLLDSHNRICRNALGSRDGYEVKSEGDSFFYVFDTALDALIAAIAIQEQLHRETPLIRVRIGIHTGEPTIRDNDYFGPQVNRTARIRDAAHGRMTLLSGATAALIGSRIPEGVELLDRGEHRLRDLGGTERLFQVMIPGVPDPALPLRTLDAQPTNLPARRASFIGRKREMDQLHQITKLNRSRLITLTGPGGVGKTELALEFAANHLVDYPDGLWYVALGDVEDPAGVLAEIAGVVLEGRTPLDPETELAAYLQGKRALLVLDNFEHVLPAATSVAALLAASPGLTCMVTSRSVLHITGELEFSVPSLSESDSLQLFLDRGQAARPGFTLDTHSLPHAVSICQQLDGLPLAIELAAARLRGLSPSQIAQRLERRFDILAGGGRDLPDRQRTMRSALDWSYEPLTEEQQKLFAELSVFASGFFLEAAEEVCTGPDVMEQLFSLRDNSLVLHEESLGESRYRMLTLIREYAATKVENLAELRQRHADYYLKLAWRWGTRVTSGHQEEALARLEIEQANLEAALHWVDETQDWKMVAEYVEALSNYAYTRGRITPFAFDLVRRAVVALESTGDTASLAALLYALGGMAWIRHEYDEAETCTATALKFFRAHEMHSRACQALSLLGLIALDRDMMAVSRARFREGLQICDECGLRLEKVVVLQNLSMLELQAGNDDEAERLAMQGIDINRELGDDVGRSYQLHTLALVAWRRGDRAAAASLFEESLDIRESLGDHPGLAMTFRELGRILAAAGHPRDGARLLFAGRRLENGSLLPFTPAHQDTLDEVTRLVPDEEITVLQSSVTEATLTDLAADARIAIARLTTMDGSEARP
jgi:predicted ATPase/class 3 adenylate cyclase